MKRGQVTVFIVIGILIVLMLVAYFSIKKITGQTELPADESVKGAIQLHVDECLEQTGENAIRLLGVRGGTIEKPVYVYQADELNTSYLYYYGDVLMPSLESMERNLSLFIDLMLPYCVDVSAFKGVSITLGKPDTTTRIAKESVFFDVEWPIEISLDDKTSIISDFQGEQEAPLYRMHAAANHIVKRTNETPLFIDQVDMLLLFMNVTYSVDGDSILYMVKEIETKGIDMAFIFATGVNRTG